MPDRIYPEASLCFTQFFNVPQRTRAVREEVRHNVHPTGAALPGPLQKRETFTIRAVTCLQRASQNLRRVSSAPLRIGFECKTKRVSNRRETRSGFRFPRARATSET